MSDFFFFYFSPFLKFRGFFEESSADLTSGLILESSPGRNFVSEEECWGYDRQYSLNIGMRYNLKKGLSECAHLPCWSSANWIFVSPPGQWRGAQKCAWG